MVIRESLIRVDRFSHLMKQLQCPELFFLDT
jgi:hypothetical protein